MRGALPPRTSAFILEMLKMLTWTVPNSAAWRVPRPLS